MGSKKRWSTYVMAAVFAVLLGLLVAGCDDDADDGARDAAREVPPPPWSVRVLAPAPP